MAVAQPVDGLAAIGRGMPPRSVARPARGRRPRPGLTAEEGADLVRVNEGVGGLGRSRPSVRRYSLRALARAVAAAVVLSAAAWAEAPGLCGPSAVAASSPTVLRIGGQAIVFAASAKEGAIYLSQNGYAYLNPGFDFESGKETSGLNASPDLAVDSGAGSPYGLVGDLGVVAPGATAVQLAVGRVVTPRVNETLAVLDAKGRYVLVQIQSVTANAVTFAYAFGAAQNRPAALGNAVWVLGHLLTFPGSARAGQITLSANGEAAVSPGFDFELNRQVSTLAEPAGLTAGVGAGGAMTLSGDMAAVTAAGRVGAWPGPGRATPVSGSTYLLVDGAGNYVLLEVTAVSATAVAFTYRLLPAKDVPVLPSGPVTLRIAGSAVTFSGPPRYGAILASRGGSALVNPGFDLASGREVAGLSASPDLALQEQGGRLTLEAVAATFNELSVGQSPSLGAVAATPLVRFVAVDALGRYVLVGLVSATAQAVTFRYEVESAGPTAVLQPPNPATVHVPAPTGTGAVVFSVYSGIGVDFGVQSGYDEATGVPVSPGAAQLMKTYALNIVPGAIWPFANLDAAQDPSLSPDGRWLATASGDAIAVRAAGGQARTIATNGDVMGGGAPVLSWSPDSRYLAYTGMVDEAGYVAGHALWVIEPSSGKSRLVVDPLHSGLGVAAVAWLPHDRLVFSTGRAFYEVSADWAHVQKLPVAAGAMGQGGRFAASADGTMLTWVARDAKGRYQVVVATLDGRQRVVFTHSAWDNWSPVFSPDASMVVYVANTGPAPGGELWGFTLNGKAAGYVQAPGSKAPITHVFDVEQWCFVAPPSEWKGQ